MKPRTKPKPDVKKKKTPMFSRFVMAVISIGVFGAIFGVAAILGVFYYYSYDLPDYSQLKVYKPPIVTRAYAGDGRLMAEFATEKRVFVPVETVPPLVVHAFLAAEDQHFFTHPGLDMEGIIRAVFVNTINMGSGKRPVGASTITQQVAKNFLLTNEVSYERKVKEAILAFRIEKTLTKNEILELYLNEIYLGNQAYGVAAAAQEYFNKPLVDLTLDEAAYLAALPKAPNNYDPVKHYQAAVDRRNWVLERMQDEDFITDDEADAARKKPITVIARPAEQYVSAPYAAEEVRRKLMEMYGEKSLYEGGLLVRTTINPLYQKVAAKALRHGLVNYDMRFGRHADPVAHFDTTDGWEEKLAALEKPKGTEDWKLALVLKTENAKAVVGLDDGSQGIIPLKYATWARRKIKGVGLGSEIAQISDALKVGDVVLAEEMQGDAKIDSLTVYHFRQAPEVEGAIMVMDPHTGRVLAMSGGFSYEMSEFNRATQALRQPGSAFKPFVYYAALEKGFTPATLILDAPLVLDQGPGLDKWRPTNYTGEFYGPTPMRIGIEKSRNLMTIRLAMFIGMAKVAEISKRFGVIDDLPQMLAMAIGAGETTLQRMVAGYAVFVNGGKKVMPTVIDRIQDREGKTIYSHDPRPCTGCGPMIPWDNNATPELPDEREQIADPKLAYQMISMMEGVVQRGTATLLKDLNRPIAGKTGTTNDSKDTWFIGFTPDLVIGVYIGFDEPRNMGKKETGGKVTAPVFKEFMQEALKNVPPVPFRVPDGIKMIQVNADTGARVHAEDQNTIWEAFVTGSEPGDEPMVFNGEIITKASEAGGNMGEGATTGLGGLY